MLVSPDIAPRQTRNAHNRNAGHFWNGTPTKIQESLPIVYETPAEEGLHEGHPEHRREHSFSNIEVYGSMTLDEVCSRYSVSAYKLTEALNIPASRSSERIGRLKRRYGFEMEELKDAIVEIRDRN